MTDWFRAAKHVGLTRTKYQFELKLTKVVLPNEHNKMFCRVIWTRGNKKKYAANELWRTDWCEGIETYHLKSSIFHDATMFTNNSNILQTKLTKLTVQYRMHIDGKIHRYCKFDIDLSKFLDVINIHREFKTIFKFERPSKSHPKLARIHCVLKCKPITDQQISKTITPKTTIKTTNKTTIISTKNNNKYIRNNSNSKSFVTNYTDSDLISEYDCESIDYESDACSSISTISNITLPVSSVARSLAKRRRGSNHFRGNVNLMAPSYMTSPNVCTIYSSVLKTFFIITKKSKKAFFQSSSPTSHNNTMIRKSPVIIEEKTFEDSFSSSIPPHISSTETMPPSLTSDSIIQQPFNIIRMNSMIRAPPSTNVNSQRNTNNTESSILTISRRSQTSQSSSQMSPHTTHDKHDDNDRKIDIHHKKKKHHHKHHKHSKHNSKHGKHKHKHSYDDSSIGTLSMIDRELLVDYDHHHHHHKRYKHKKDRSQSVFGVMVGTQSPISVVSSKSTSVLNTINNDNINIREMRRKILEYEEKQEMYKIQLKNQLSLKQKMEEQEIESNCMRDELCELKKKNDEYFQKLQTIKMLENKIRILENDKEILLKKYQSRNKTIIELGKQNKMLQSKIGELSNIEVYDDEYKYDSENEHKNDEYKINHKIEHKNENEIGHKIEIENKKNDIFPETKTMIHLKIPLKSSTTNNNIMFNICKNINKNTDEERVDTDDDLDPLELKKWEEQLSKARRKSGQWSDTVLKLNKVAEIQQQRRSSITSASISHNFGKDEVITPTKCNNSQLPPSITITSINTHDKETSPTPSMMSIGSATSNVTCKTNVDMMSELICILKNQTQTNPGNSSLVVDGNISLNKKQAEEILRIIQSRKLLKAAANYKQVLKYMELSNITSKKHSMKVDEIFETLKQQWMYAENEKIAYKKLYEKCKKKLNVCNNELRNVKRECQKSEAEIAYVQSEFSDLQLKYEVMEEVSIKLRHDLSHIHDEYDDLRNKYRQKCNQ